MLRNVTMVGVVGFLLLFTACTVKEEDSLVKAVKDYPILDFSVEEVLAAKDKMLQKKGIKTEYSWETKKVDGKTYNVIANISVKAGKKKSEQYIWQLTRNELKSSNQESFWRLKPSNKPARKLMQIKRKRIEAWLGMGL